MYILQRPLHFRPEWSTTYVLNDMKQYHALSTIRSMSINCYMLTMSGIQRGKCRFVQDPYSIGDTKQPNLQCRGKRPKCYETSGVCSTKREQPGDAAAARSSSQIINTSSIIVVGWQNRTRRVPGRNVQKSLKRASELMD